MKKVKIILIGTCSVVLIILFGKFLWDGLLCDILPWTKTNFASHQEYLELLDEHHVLGSTEFTREIPADVAEVKYYWHRDYKEKYTAYSMVLTEEGFKEIVEDRMYPYVERCNGDTTELVCALQEMQYGIDDLRQLGVEIDYIQNVLQNPDEQQEYYCLVVIKTDTYKATCYTGVILNDTTHEIIEFSVEVPERIG